MSASDESCPRCGNQFTHSIVCDEFNIDHKDARQAKTCGRIAMDNDEPVIEIYYHLADDLGTAQETYPDPGELGGDRSIVFDLVHRATVSDGSIKQVELKGDALDAMDPDRAVEVVEELVDEGFVEQVTNGVYRDPRVAVEAEA